MLVVFPPIFVSDTIFVADTKLTYGYNFVARLISFLKLTF